MPATRWFAGPEFVWLDKQVEASLWRGDVAAPIPPSEPKASARPTLHYRPFDGMIIDAAKQQAIMTAAANQAPQVSAMSVDEYNTWRGMRPPKQIDQLPYIHQDFPKWVYHPNGERKIVNDAYEHRRHLDNGWRDKP